MLNVCRPIVFQHAASESPPPARDSIPDTTVQRCMTKYKLQSYEKGGCFFLRHSVYDLTMHT